MEEVKTGDSEGVVPRRRRKMVRAPRDKTPDPHQSLQRWSKCSDSENDSSNAERRSADEKPMSEHKRKILDKKNKAILNRRSLSNPRVIDNNQQSELFALLKTARRSLSSPREPTESRESKLKVDKTKEDKLKPYGNRSIPNLTEDVKTVKTVLKTNLEEAKPTSKSLSKLAKKTLNNDEKQELIKSFNRAQKSTLNKIDIDNDTYESSTESCSISENDNATHTTITKAIVQLKKIEPKVTNNKQQPTKPTRAPKKVQSDKLSYILLIKESRKLWKEFKVTNQFECRRINSLRNKCISDMIAMMIFCGCGGMIFKFTEGTFENFYKCGVKRVKRDFIDQLWQTSMHMREEDWKSQARNKLRAFEEELHAAHEAGMKTYSGQRGWSFLNGVVYCLTVVTTIGYGHISPVTTTGRAITIAYAIIGIPMFLILLADFGKLFTRCIKFVWAFVRRVYYTGSCRKVRRTAPVQEVMKGFNIVYDLAHFRRPSQAAMHPISVDPELAPRPMMKSMSAPTGIPQTPGYLGAPSAGVETPQTPAPSAFEIDDEFNLPISVAIFILLIYIFIGATIYYIWEDWGFFESFYFVFISMSTIGFGDFVPQHPMYMMASIVYLVFGLALTSMCINVVQVKLSDSFRQASAKIGATIGLKMAEEEASAVGTPPTVEIAEVHGSTSHNPDPIK